MNLKQSRPGKGQRADTWFRLPILWKLACEGMMKRLIPVLFEILDGRKAAG